MKPHREIGKNQSGPKGKRQPPKEFIIFPMKSLESFLLQNVLSHGMFAEILKPGMISILIPPSYGRESSQTCLSLIIFTESPSGIWISQKDWPPSRNPFSSLWAAMISSLRLQAHGILFETNSRTLLVEYLKEAVIHLNTKKHTILIRNSSHGSRSTSKTTL